MKRLPVVLLFLTGAMTTVAPAVLAQEGNDGTPTGAAANEEMPKVRLQDLLTEVAASSGKEFLVHSWVEPMVQIGGTPLDDPSYPVLLSVLRNNNLAGVEIEGRVHVIPAQIVRQMPLPVVQRDDADIPDEAWVTRILTLDNVNAPHLVPILRPLLPQEAHMAALPPNKLLIVDRYANVRRITSIVEALSR